MQGEGFEPSRLAAIGPQPIVSASSTIPASRQWSNEGRSIGGGNVVSPSYRSAQKETADGHEDEGLPGLPLPVSTV